jgi:hypothetical protein
MSPEEQREAFIDHGMEQLDKLLKKTFPGASKEDLVKLTDTWAYVNGDEEAYLKRHLEAAADVYVCSISGDFEEFIEEVLRTCPPKFPGPFKRTQLMELLARMLVEEIRKAEAPDANADLTSVD